MGNRGMDDLIVVVNQLQDAFAQLGRECPIDLPQIAVVGGQSAGKSSVLENFVGKDFLPRGSGIVTRRPLILQLLHHSGREYGEFLHQPSKKFTDFNEIRKEIEAETDRMTGQNKGISSIPINLKVYSPHVLDLTLVDLPGITKVPVGDQPKDIEHQIRNMIMEFITKPNCLILAVSPANSDLANSDALKLAKEVDPQGLRTIGVITKLDLMDQGTDARDILENRLLPLRRGYVGVVNRSQADIDGNKDIRKAMAAERQFFATHPAYRHIAAKMGTPRLQQVLNQQLSMHIKETLPELRNQLQAEAVRLDKECAEFKGMESTGGRGASTKLMMTYMHTFSDDWWKSIDGGGEINLDQLSGGAKINRIFFERFPYELNKNEYDERQLRREITYAIKNIHGVRSGLFTPDEAFEAVCKKLIERMRAPALLCVELSMNELCDISSNVAEKVSRFPRLRDELERITQAAIKENFTITCQQTELLIDCEKAYINTMHPNFVGYQQATAPPQTAGGGGVGGVGGIFNKGQDQRKTVNMGNQVIRRGFLSTPSGNLDRYKEFWFVLNSDSIAWYKDEQEQEQKYYLKLSGCKVRDVKGSSWTGKTRHVFEIYNPELKFLYKENKSLVLSAESENQKDEWKASLLRVGVFPDKAAQEDDEDAGEGGGGSNQASLDPVLEKQVENIRSLVDSYMDIVGSTVRDLVPKTIMCFLVNTVKEFLKSELVGSLYGVATPEALMEESADEQQRREDMLRMLKLSKDALKLLADVNVSNIGNSAYDDDAPAARTPNSPPMSRLPPRPTPNAPPAVDKPAMPSRPGKPSLPDKPNKPARPQRP